MRKNLHYQLPRAPSQMMFIALLATPLVAAFAVEPKANVPPARTQPKLILQITVDQLRGDMPERFLKNMGQGGFRYLLDQGVWYANAHHAFANTETMVGHTTLATGADPSVHGMVGNTWLNRASGKVGYAI